jgi:menaquinol-cytochrome c reductase iron-sulfur subunit
MAKPDSKPTIEAPPRRMFLKVLTALGGAVAALFVAIPGIGYFTGSLRKTASQRVKLGPANSFPVNQTRLVTFENPLAEKWDGVTAQSGVYVRNLGQDAQFKEQFQVFAINCTHLGCPVEWFPQSGLFMCPCHGGVYYENGDHASGPPPRGLYHCEWEVSQETGDDQPQLYIVAPFLPTLQHTLTGRRESAI